MKYFVQFLEHDAKGNVTDAIGSESVFVLDGRERLESMKGAARERMRLFQDIHPSWIGFKIIRGGLNARTARFNEEIYRENKQSELADWKEII